MTSLKEKIDRDLERYKEMKKSDYYDRFNAFLRKFDKNLKQYDRIVIRTDYVGAKRGYCTRTMFDGSETIKEHYDEIWIL